MFKKIISVILSLMIMSTMFTGVVFAADTTADVSYVSPKEYVGNPSVGLHVRNKEGSGTDNIDAPTSGYYQIQLNGYNTGFISYDFVGNEAAIYAAKEITFSVNSTYSDQRVRKFNIYAVDDRLESAFNNKLTWNIANDNGLLSGGTLIGQYTGESLWSVSFDINKEALVNALKQNPSNTKLVLRFKDASGGNTTSINWKSAKFTFKYDAADEAYTNYLDNIASSLKWSDISEQSESEITNNITLPEKIYGADVEWISDNAAISSDGTVTQPRGSDATVNLTAKLSYNGHTASKTFRLIVPAITATSETISYVQRTWVRGGEHAGNVQSISYEEFYVHKQEHGTTNDRYAFYQFDLSGYEDKIENASKVTFTLKNNNSTTPFTIAVLKGKCDGWSSSSLTFNLADEMGMLSNSDNAIVAVSGVSLTASTPYTTDNFADVLKAALAEDPLNSLFTFRIYGDTTSQIVLKYPSISLNIEYYKDDLDTGKLFSEKKNTLEWSHISTQSLNNVREDINLPSKFYGFDVKWSSNNEAVISSDGTVTRGNATQKATLTATVSYNGETSTKDFELTVPKLAYGYGEDLYDGSKALSVTMDGVSSASTLAKITIEDGLGGKNAGDKIYKMISSSTSVFAGLGVSNASGADDVFEFSAYVPSGATGLDFNIGIVDETQYGAQTKFVVKNDGIYYNHSDDKNLIYKFVSDEWHTFAFVAPKGDGEDTSYEIYVDGIQVTSGITSATTEGFRHIRIYGTNSEGLVNGYLDNVRIYSGSYDAKYDANPEFASSYDVAGRVITVTDANTTAGDIKASIAYDEDVRYTLTDVSGNAISDDSIKVYDGMKIYVTTSNGTEIDRNYAVYTVRCVAGVYVIDSPAISIDGDKVTAKLVSYNYTGSNENYVAILAVYKDGALAEPVAVKNVSNIKGTKAETTLSAAYADGCTVKLMVWDNMTDIIPLMTASSR